MGLDPRSSVDSSLRQPLAVCRPASVIDAGRARLGAISASATTRLAYVERLMAEHDDAKLTDLLVTLVGQDERETPTGTTQFPVRETPTTAKVGKPPLLSISRGGDGLSLVSALATH
jgi:hypothetical protein